MRTTHTFALLDVSASTYAEIRAKLEAADYGHALHDDGAIDMHGLAIVLNDGETKPREAGCLCHLEEGDSPCPVHGVAEVLRGARAAMKATEAAASTVHAMPDPENPFGHEPVDRLLRFKTYVHERLDQMNVPADPEPAENAAHGCRIEGRLNWLLDQMIAAEDKAETLEAKLTEANATIAELTSLDPNRCPKCGLDPAIKNLDCERCSS